jgi:hypothetical protein
MSYNLQFGKSGTLASVMTIGEVTSATLSGSSFTNFTADFLVLDYDVPAKREVIKCNVTGTAISSITRGQEGTSAVQHEAGAKVGYNLVPSHLAFLGDAWTTYTPTWTLTGAGSQAGTITGAYMQIGKTVHFWAKFVCLVSSNFTGLTGVTVSLPVTSSAIFGTPGSAIGTGGMADANGNYYPLTFNAVDTTKGQVLAFAASGASVNYNPVAEQFPFATGAGDTMFITGTYETA